MMMTNILSQLLASRGLKKVQPSTTAQYFIQRGSAEIHKYNDTRKTGIPLHKKHKCSTVFIDVAWLSKRKTR